MNATCAKHRDKGVCKGGDRVVIQDMNTIPYVRPLLAAGVEIAVAACPICHVNVSRLFETIEMGHISCCCKPRIKCLWVYSASEEIPSFAKPGYRL